MKCETSYCLKCSYIVHQQPAISTHHRVPIQQKPTEPARCKIHPNENLKYWCFSCNRVICRNCQLAKDHDHKVIDVIDIVNDVEKELKNKLESAQSFVEKALESAEKVASSNKNLSKDKITDVFTCIRAAVDTCERELNEGIDEIDDNNKARLEKYQQNVADRTLKLEQYRKELENILVDNNYEMLLQLRENFIENIDRIGKDLEKLDSSVEIRFTIENIDNLQAAVQDALKTVKIVQKQGNLPIVKIFPF
ncbi:unnamed protein product [Rotaria socialis]